MGNSFAGWFPVGSSQKEGTTLVELNIHHMRDAHGIIGERPNDAFTPVTLVPSTAMESCCCIPMCYVSIPAGFAAIVTQFGAVVPGDKPDGTWSEGFHCFKPWYQVDKMVSQQLVVFDTPVKDCKTKDAITVNIDVLLQFEIKQAREFVYNIGPEKFDDYLRASQDEALRQMAMETTVENIYDLHGVNTMHIIDEMNAKFEKYGVHVHHFTIKNVRLPSDMASDWQDKTLFESKTKEQQMQQEFDRLKLNNDENQKKLAEECENNKMVEEQRCEVVMKKAKKETAEVVASTSRDIQELEASRDNEVKKVYTQAELEVSKIQAQIRQMDREMNNRTQATCASIKEKAAAKCEEILTTSKLEVATKLANGKKALAAAEGEASAAFATRRAHEAAMKRLEVLNEVTTKDGTIIASSQENTIGMSADNAAVTQAAQQGLEALRAKLAEITATSLKKLEQTQPAQQRMRPSR